MNNEEKILSMLETLVTKVDTIETRLDGMEAKFEARFDAQDARFDTHDARFDRLERELSEVNRRVTKIENEHGTLLKGLGDGYRALQATTDKILSDVSEIKARQEMQDLKIKFIDANQKKFG
jgi:predicted  nucleic acid-binding Zn-ribbon protein